MITTITPLNLLATPCVRVCILALPTIYVFSDERKCCLFSICFFIILHRRCDLLVKQTCKQLYVNFSWTSAFPLYYFLYFVTVQGIFCLLESIFSNLSSLNTRKSKGKNELGKKYYKENSGIYEVCAGAFQMFASSLLLREGLFLRYFLYQMIHSSSIRSRVARGYHPLFIAQAIDSKVLKRRERSILRKVHPNRIYTQVLSRNMRLGCKTLHILPFVRGNEVHKRSIWLYVT